MKGSNRIKRPLPMGPAHAERGFVQGVLLFALAVLVAIIAAFAFANNGNQSSSERESAKVTATVLMKQASDMQDAVSRYISDGYSLGYLCVLSSNSQAAASKNAGNNVVQQGCTGTPTPIWIFDSANGYMTPPTAPSAAFAANSASASRVWKYADFSDAGRVLSATTTPGVFAWVQAEEVDKKVCQAINRMLNLTFPKGYSGDDEEACYTDGTTHYYRKVIASRKQVGL